MRTLLLQGGFAAGFIALWVGVWHAALAAALSTGTSLWYPPAALTFSLLAVAGPRWVWLPLVASLIAGQQVWQGAPTIFELAGSLGHAVSYLAAALLFRWLTPSPRIVLTPRVLSRFLIAGLFGAALSAVLGTLNHQLATLEGAVPLGRAVVAWFAGDALGVMSLAPFIVFVALPCRRRLLRRAQWPGIAVHLSKLVLDVALTATIAGLVGVCAWVAEVDIVPITALAAGGALVLLTGYRRARNSLATLAVVMTTLALVSLVVPERRDLIEGGLVMLVSTLLMLVTLQQAMALRQERVHHARLSQQIRRLRAEYDRASGDLDKMKTRIAELGHELRTPLNAVIGYAGLIRMKAEGRAEGSTAEHAGIIERSGEFLLLLINDILDSASLRRNALSLQMQDTDPLDAVRSVREMLAHRASGKEQPLEAAEANVPAVRADPVRLKQVLVNLVQNAIKYCPKGTPITLSMADVSDRGEVCLSVIDAGPGLSTEELELALQPFTRASDRDREGGSGVGLPLALQLIQEMGGRTDIDTAPGRGTAIHLYMPRAEGAS